MKLTNKVILVMGASGAIGKAIAEVFLSEGGTVLRTSSGSLQQDEYVFVTDVTSEESVRALFLDIEKKYGKLDVLVTAFGVYGSIDLLRDSSIQEWKKAFDVNLFGVVLAIKYAIPLLEKSNYAKIITFAGGGEGSKPHFSSYVCSKTATIRLVETLAEELKQSHIDINCISPGAVKSRFTQEILTSGPEKSGQIAYDEAVQQMNDSAETTPPNRVAELALFLAMSDSDGITGKNISVTRDPWNKFAEYKNQIMGSDIYSLRRIKPKDRGYDW